MEYDNGSRLAPRCLPVVDMAGLLHFGQQFVVGLWSCRVSVIFDGGRVVAWSFWANTVIEIKANRIIDNSFFISLMVSAAKVSKNNEHSLRSNRLYLIISHG
jgi:hypothetical protein